MFFNSQRREQEEKFLETIRDFLFQHILEPTRCRGTDDLSTIDLILTDEKNQMTGLTISGTSRKN